MKALVFSVTLALAAFGAKFGLVGHSGGGW